MARSKSKNVGVIGLGIIGSRIAGVLRKRGFQVFVWNRTPRLEQNFVGSPAEVAELCNFLQIFVSDDNALLEIVSQLVPALTAHHVVMAHSTIGPDTMRTAAEMVERRGARFLEAPFTGSKVAAENGQLVYYIGGDELALKQVRPVLEASSKDIIPIGEIGTASIIKVATNIVTAATAQIGAEALAIVRRAGISGETFGRAMKANASNSATLEMKVPMILKGDFEPHFSVKHMLKDVRIAARLARESGMQVPMTELASDMLLAEMKQGRGDADYSSVAQRYFPVSGKPVPPPLETATWKEKTESKAEPAPVDQTAEPEPPPAEVTRETPKLEPTEVLEESGPFAIEREAEIAEELKPPGPETEVHEPAEMFAAEINPPEEGSAREEPSIERVEPAEAKAEAPGIETVQEAIAPAEVAEPEPTVPVEPLTLAEIAPPEIPVEETPLEETAPEQPVASEIKPEEPPAETPAVEVRDPAEGMLVKSPSPAEIGPAHTAVEETPSNEAAAEQPITTESEPIEPPTEMEAAEVHDPAEGMLVELKPSPEVPNEPEPDQLPPIRLKVSAPQKPEQPTSDAEKLSTSATAGTAGSEPQPDGIEQQPEEGEAEAVNLSGGFRGWFSRVLAGRRKDRS